MSKELKGNVGRMAESARIFKDCIASVYAVFHNQPIIIVFF